MGRSQVYRGNPELKQYYLINDFSGGVNTSDVDERVTDSEFRELINVDLSERGKVQNRKGFGLMSNLRSLLTTNTVTLPSDKLVFVNVFQDLERILEKIETYDSLSDFQTGELNTIYNVIIVLGYVSATEFKVYHLKLLNDNIDWAHFAQLSLIETITLSGTTKEIPTTGINTVVHNNSIYISLNDVASGNTGILKLQVDAIDFIGETTIVPSIIDLYNSYMPNPYEISNVGFNLMSNEPSTYVSIDSSGIAEIRSVFITDGQSDVPLLYIPKSGSFTMNVITKGNLLDLDGIYVGTQLKVTAYALDLDGTKRDLDVSYSLIEQQEASAILQYNVTIRLESALNIVLKIAKEEVVTDLLKKTDNTLANIISFFSASGKKYLVQTGSKYYTIYKQNGTNYYGYATAYYPAYSYKYPATQITYTAEARSTVDLPIVRYTGLVFPNYTFTADTPAYEELKGKTSYAVLHNTTTGNYHLDIISFDFHTGKPVSNGAGGGFSDELLTGFIEDINDYTMTIGDVVLVDDTSTQTFYSYLGTQLGTSADFEEVDSTLFTDDLLSYLSNYDVKDTEFSKEIEPINLTNIKLILINKRLVIYNGNTILFSDEKKFDYFPSYNYIVLDLHGGDSIQKIAYFRGSWVIFTKEMIYRMSGDFGQENFLITLINDSIGCVSPNSVRGVNNTLVFLSRDGIYAIKQNFYMDGLENVEKIDKNIRGLYSVGSNYDSLIYNEQYWLFVKGNAPVTVKQYYNMEYSRRTFPYVIDKYTVQPDLLFKSDGSLYSIKYGDFYKYDVGYTDFEPYLTLEADKVDYMYKMTITTPGYMLGAPTHDKKFKNLYIKTDSLASVPIYITLYVNNMVWSTPYQYYASVNDLGEIEYREILNKVSSTTVQEAAGNLELSDPLTQEVIDTIDTDLVLGGFELSEATLGLDRYQVHKITTSAKGKVLAIKIEQKLNQYFAILDIGVLYKLGKVKES